MALELSPVSRKSSFRHYQASYITRIYISCVFKWQINYGNPVTPLPPGVSQWREVQGHRHCTLKDWLTSVQSQPHKALSLSLLISEKDSARVCSLPDPPPISPGGLLSLMRTGEKFECLKKKTKQRSGVLFLFPRALGSTSLAQPPLWHWTPLYWASPLHFSFDSVTHGPFVTLAC